MDFEMILIGAADPLLGLNAEKGDRKAQLGAMIGQEGVVEAGDIFN